LEQRGLTPKFVASPDVYCVIDGDAGRLAAFPVIHALRGTGLRVDYPMKPGAFGKQLKAAIDSGAKLALIYGGDEIAKGVVKIRDLSEKSEREVPRDGVVEAVRDFFA
jgi:histidyl-tRNA synthetase